MVSHAYIYAEYIVLHMIHMVHMVHMVHLVHMVYMVYTDMLNILWYTLTSSKGFA